jgi:hypothetical protein
MASNVLEELADEGELAKVNGSLIGTTISGSAWTRCATSVY